MTRQKQIQNRSSMHESYEYLTSRFAKPSKKKPRLCTIPPKAFCHPSLIIVDPHLGEPTSDLRKDAETVNAEGGERAETRFCWKRQFDAEAVYSMREDLDGVTTAERFTHRLLNSSLLPYPKKASFCDCLNCRRDIRTSNEPGV